jgi:hypothetical protein
MKKNGKWQMISPVEENSCRAFGIESVELHLTLLFLFCHKKVQLLLLC